jgi:hypothetical protein
MRRMGQEPVDYATPSTPAARRGRTVRGKWIVLAIVALGALLGLVGRLFRPAPPATPTTAEAKPDQEDAGHEWRE